MTNQGNPQVEVTQADIDAAADFLESWEPGPEPVLVKLSRRFAKHRLASQRPAVGDDAVERVARIIDPGSWAVMDSELERTKRKYRGQNVAWPEDQFKHKESMALAKAVIAAMQPQAPATGDVAELVQCLRSNWGDMSCSLRETLDEAAAKLTELQAQVDRLKGDASPAG